jgi:hypothetical protein
MKQVAVATAVAGLAFVAFCNASKAAPIAPLPSGVISDTNNVVPAYYYHHRYYPYFYHGHYYSYRYHGHYYRNVDIHGNYYGHY